MGPRDAAVETARQLERALGPRLRSVILYGSVARDEYIHGRSDVNLLLLLDDVDSRAIALAAPVTASMAAARVNPLVLEWDDRTRAADVFGIELLDLRDAHETLFGINPFIDLIINRAALRLQCEGELRAKLLGLHSAMLHAREDAAFLGQLLINALPSFATYLRAVLRLAGQPVPATTRTVIEAGCARVLADPAGLIAALEARIANKAWKLDLDNPFVEAYRAACERTARWVDEFSGD
jgi:predicted nucleotidyltransferase